MTTDELIKLAEFCGHTWYYGRVRDAVEVIREIRTPSMSKSTTDIPSAIVIETGVEWQPHLDANQRDELVEALCKAGYEVHTRNANTSHGKSAWNLCQLFWSGRLHGEQWHSQTGTAVCNAALQAIAHMEANNGTA